MAEETKLSPEVQSVVDGIKQSVEGFKEKIQSKAETATVESMQETLESIKGLVGDKNFSEEIDGVKSELEKIAGEVKSMKELPDAPLHIKEQINKQLKEKHDDLKSVAEKGSGTVKLNLKVDSTNIGDRVVFGLREPGIAKEQRPVASILEIIQIVFGGPGSNPLSWVERDIVSGAAAPTAEGATKPTREIEWVENKVTSETIAVYTPVSKKSVLNLPIIEQEIRDDHNEDLRIALETQIYRGTGVSPQLNGLITVYGTPYSSGALSNTVVQPDNSTVIRAIVAQMQRANFMGDYICMKPELIVTGKQ